ncbi:MAG: acyltransferase [Flavobacterium sp.]|nr:acyltransferase [Flavobacterium sp.]MBP8157673.1 acyltransferase [Flavobacterium sp.]
MIKHISGLNGIRAIAVLMVIVSHRFPIDHFLRIMPIGHFGVDIFFVLSGYLISRILFKGVDKIKNNSATAYQLIKSFVIRRSLRIFPIYYLLLLVLYFTGGIIGNSFRDNFLWYFFYGSNYLIYNEGKWFGCLAHLWSLAVEEQFYLVWPFLVLVLFRNRIFTLLLITILAGTLSPLFIDGITYVLTISCVNAFGIGALLAYVELMKPQWRTIFIKTVNVLAIVSVALIFFHYFLYEFSIFFDRLLVSLIAVALIAYCRFHQESFLVTHILENKVLSFIGLISYGVYLYHNIIPRYWVVVLNRIGLDTASTMGKFSYLEFFIQTAFVIFVSYMSWIIIEKPISKWKDKIS